MQKNVVLLTALALLMVLAPVLLAEEAGRNSRIRVDSSYRISTKVLNPLDGSQKISHTYRSMTGTLFGETVNLQSTSAIRM